MEVKTKERFLSLQRQAFVDHLCTDASWNGAEAARLAKYSEKTARIQAAQLLTLPSIQQAIEQKKAELYSGIAASEEEVRRNHRLAQSLALGKGDLTTYTRNTELLGKTLAMYADKNINIGEKTVIIISPKAPKQVNSEVIEQE